MFEQPKLVAVGSAVSGPEGLLGASDISAWTAQLLEVDRDAGDTERVDLLRALEELKCAAEAAQAVMAADLDVSQRAVQAAAGVPEQRRGRGVAAQVALARRESHHRGQQHLGLAKILAAELPHTFAAFRAGRVTEWRATLVARETACLCLADRRVVDVEVAGDPARIETMGEGELVSELRKLAYRLDAASFVERRARAEAERRVTLRPAPEVMSQLSALLPLKQGVAVFAALSAHAKALITEGDPRSKGQIMADTLTDRILQPTAGKGGVGVMINLIVADRVLFAGSDDPGFVEGYGPVPADLARQLACGLAEQDQAWLRRLYVRPVSGELVAMDSVARAFPTRLAELLRVRDQRCRTPWCDAAIRHGDHVEAVAEGGLTTAVNGQGLCVACNHAKQAHGWSARPRPGPRHTVETTTPTGHVYTSCAPRLTRRLRVDESPVELYYTEMVLTA